MNGQANGSITIDKLRIRISTGAIAPARGQQLGERVQQLLVERLTAWDGNRDREIGAITISLNAPDDASVERLASRIVDAILRQV